LDCISVSIFCWPFSIPSETGVIYGKTRLCYFDAEMTLCQGRVCGHRSVNRTKAPSRSSERCIEVLFPSKKYVSKLTKYQSTTIVLLRHRDRIHSEPIQSRYEFNRRPTRIWGPCHHNQYVNPFYKRSQ
jgi:hypothetical protein